MWQSAHTNPGEALASIGKRSPHHLRPHLLPLLRREGDGAGRGVLDHGPAGVGWVGEADREIPTTSSRRMELSIATTPSAVFAQRPTPNNRWSKLNPAFAQALRKP